MVKWTDFLLPAAIIGGAFFLFRGGQSVLSDVLSAFGIGGGRNGGFFNGGARNGEPTATLPDVIRETGRAVGLGLFEAGAGAGAGILAVRAARRVPLRIPSFLQRVVRPPIRPPFIPRFAVQPRIGLGSPVFGAFPIVTSLREAEDFYRRFFRVRVRT